VYRGVVCRLTEWVLRLLLLGAGLFLRNPVAASLSAPSLDDLRNPDAHLLESKVASSNPNLLRKQQLNLRELDFRRATIFRDKRPDLWNLSAIEVQAAWAKGARGQGIIVAVIDSGVEEGHPDLRANLWPERSEKLKTAATTEPPLVINTPFRTSSMPAVEGQGFGCHGTSVAGIVAAIGHNQRGVIGVAPEARVMSLRGTSSAEAIRYAVDHGARVINMSWFAIRADIPAISAALDYAHARGVVLVAAAGNDDAIHIDFPASHPHVIAVGGWTYDGQRAPASNHGPAIDVVAPGKDVLTTFEQKCRSDRAVDWRNHYGIFGGTSAASPHVAGLAALLLSVHPEWTPDQVRSAIRASATDVLTPGFDLESSRGLVNARRALEAPGDLPELSLHRPTNDIIIRKNQTFAIRGTVTGKFERYQLLYSRLVRSPQAKLQPWKVLSPPFRKPVRDAVLYQWKPEALPKGWYIIRLIAETASGFTVEDAKLLYLADPA